MPPRKKKNAAPKTAENGVILEPSSVAAEHTTAAAAEPATETTSKTQSRSKRTPRKPRKNDADEKISDFPIEKTDAPEASALTQSASAAPLSPEVVDPLPCAQRTAADSTEEKNQKTSESAAPVPELKSENPDTVLNEISQVPLEEPSRVENTEVQSRDSILAEDDAVEPEIEGQVERNEHEANDTVQVESNEVTEEVGAAPCVDSEKASDAPEVEVDSSDTPSSETFASTSESLDPSHLASSSPKTPVASRPTSETLDPARPVSSSSSSTPTPKGFWSWFQYAPRPAHLPPSVERKKQPAAAPTGAKSPMAPETVSPKAESEPSVLASAKRTAEWILMNKISDRATQQSSAAFRASKECLSLSKEATTKAISAEGSLRRAKACEVEAVKAAAAVDESDALVAEARDISDRVTPFLRPAFLDRVEAIASNAKFAKQYSRNAQEALNAAMVAATSKASSERIGDVEKRMRETVAQTLTHETLTSKAFTACVQAANFEFATTARANTEKYAKEAAEFLRRSHEIHSTCTDEKIAEFTLELLIEADKASQRCDQMVLNASAEIDRRVKERESFEAAIPFADAASKAVESAARSTVFAAKSESAAVKHAGIARGATAVSEILRNADLAGKAAKNAREASEETSEHEAVANDASIKAAAIAPGSHVCARIEALAKRARELATAARVSAEKATVAGEEAAELGKRAEEIEGMVRKCLQLEKVAAECAKTAFQAAARSGEARDTCRLMAQKADNTRVAESSTASALAERASQMAQVQEKTAEEAATQAHEAAAQAMALSLQAPKGASSAKKAYESSTKASESFASARSSAVHAAAFAQQAAASSVFRFEEEKAEEARRAKIDAEINVHVFAVESALRDAVEGVAQAERALIETKSAVTSCDALAAADVAKKAVETVTRAVQAATFAFKECRLLSVGSREPAILAAVERAAAGVREAERSQSAAVVHSKNAMMCALRKSERENVKGNGQDAVTAEILKQEEIAATACDDADNARQLTDSEKMKTLQSCGEGDAEAAAEHAMSASSYCASAKRAAAIAAEAAGAAKNIERKNAGQPGSKIVTIHSSKRASELAEQAAMHWRSAEGSVSRANAALTAAQKQQKVLDQKLKKTESIVEERKGAVQSREIGGVGIHLDWVPGEGHYVVGMLVGKPAFNSKAITNGDVVVKIGHIDVSSRSSCRDLLPGRVGTDVTLILRKGGPQGTTVSVTLTRGPM